MSKFDYRNFDLEPYIEPEEGSRGNDGMIYGNLIDWNRFRSDEEENLLAYFDVNLPWGEKLDLFEYFKVIKQEVFEQTTIIEDSGLDNLDIVNSATKIAEVEVRFPDRNDEIISAVFEYYAVPSGVDYEHDLPQELQYGHSMLEDDYQYYRRYPLEFNYYNQTIDEIKTKMQNTQDGLTKKALLLSSFIISESLLKSMIVSMIPVESHISPFNSKLLENTISKKLRGSVDERNNFFKLLFGSNAPNQDWTALRNSLAHDIEKSSLNNDDITYINMKSEQQETKNINNLFTELKTFSSKLEQIINNHN